MDSGWSLDEATPRLRSRLPNLNLLPAELVPMPLPWLTAGLALFALGLLMLLYALFYMKAYTDLELGALRDRLTTAQQVAGELGLPADGGTASLPPGTLEDWAELRARQVDWASVFSTIATGLGAVQLSGVSQAGYTVSIAGEAATANDANQFLQKLRDSGLFASLEMSITGLESPPASQAQPTAGVGPPPATALPPTAAAKPQPTTGPPAPPVGAQQPPGQQQPAVPPTAAAKPQPAAPAPAQPAVQPTLAPRTPLASPSPVGSVAPATPAAVATALPAYDFIVQSKRETVDPSRQADFSHIRVRVVDSGGNLIPGLKVRVESEGQPPWGDTYPHPDHPASNGTFDMGVGMGKFTVFVMNGFSERATGLFTGVAGQPGVHEWDVTFTKVTPGAAPAEATCPGCSPTPTPTITLTVAPTATPISPGQNLAAQACVTASHGNDAYRAVDGNLDTAWESGRGPIVQITLDFTRYPNTHALACQPKAAGESRVVQLEALEFVTRMDGRSRQTHEVWTVYDTGTAQLEHTFADVDVADYTTISARFAATRSVQQLRIRTIRSGVNVGWREIRLFEPLPPAFGNVATNTPTASPSPTPTAPPNEIQFASAQASSENAGNPAPFAIDGNADTFWRPVAQQAGPYLRLAFTSPQTVQTVRFQIAAGDSVATATATAGAGTPTSTPGFNTFRVVLLRPSLNAQGRVVQEEIDRRALDDTCYVSSANADRTTMQFQCTQAFTGVTGVQINIDSIGNPAIPPGIREIDAYPPVSTPTPNPTQTAAAAKTATVAACRTQVASTPASRSAQQVPDTQTPTLTATQTSTSTRTPTHTPTLTGDQAIQTQVAATGTSIAVQTNVAATLTAIAVASRTVTPTGTPTGTPTVTPTNTPLGCGNASTASVAAESQEGGTSLLAALWGAARDLWRVGEAQAAPLEQGIATPLGKPAVPTQVVIGAPQQSNVPLPPAPISLPVAVPLPQSPSGRVAFTIVGQVRPGGQ